MQGDIYIYIYIYMCIYRERLAKCQDTGNMGLGHGCEGKARARDRNEARDRIDESAFMTCCCSVVRSIDTSRVVMVRGVRSVSSDTQRSVTAW